MRETNIRGYGRCDGDRRGFVLAIALLSLLLIAALLAAAFFAATEESRTSAAATSTEKALLDAESAVESSIAAIAEGSLVLPDIGATTPVGDQTARSYAHLSRLDSTVLWIVGEGRGTGSISGATRRVGVFLSVSADSTGSIRVSRIPDRGWSELF